MSSAISIILCFGMPNCSRRFKQAFHQVKLAQDCRDVPTFITNWGLHHFKRLLFGVNYTQELFQNIMESIFCECDNTVIFKDDIMIFGATEEEHDLVEKHTLSVINRYGILLNIHKYKFKRSPILFLGHELSSKGVAPTKDKVKSIQQVRAPQSKAELRSYLGLVTWKYYLTGNVYVKTIEFLLLHEDSQKLIPEVYFGGSPTKKNCIKIKDTFHALYFAREIVEKSQIRILFLSSFWCKQI